MHDYITKPELVAGSEVMNLFQRSERAPGRCCCHRGRCNEERKTEFAMEHACMPDMVAVVMGDDDSVHFANVAAVRSKPFCGLYPGYACVK
jgi:hypothetical protein